MPRGKRRGRKPQSAFVKKLTSMVGKLKADYDSHHSALKTIEGIFRQIGIPVGDNSTEGNEVYLRRGAPKRTGKRGPGRPPKSASAAASTHASASPPKGPRGSYGATANKTIIAFVREGGTKGRTTSEINQHWKSQGRPGNAYVNLGDLVKRKQLKRKNMPGERGSRYTAA